MRILSFILLVVMLAGCSGSGNESEGDKSFGTGDYKSAIEKYNQELASNPDNVKLLYNRGRAFEELKKFDQAEQDFLKVLALEEKHLNATLSLSKLYYQKKAYNKAVIFADKALDINENSAEGHFLAARAKHQLGYVDGALESYTLAINVNKNYGEAYLYRGALKVHKKQTRSACDDFNKALSLEVPEARSIVKKYCK